MILATLEVQEKENLEEDAFEKEMLRRFDDYEQGRITPITLDELEAKVRKSHKDKMKSM
jgi:putative addiction module component (TIGR02574 family)